MRAVIVGVVWRGGGGGSGAVLSLSVCGGSRFDLS